MTAKDVANHVKDDLGFPQYADMFIKQDISGEELPSLVKQDLIDMGIISVGHRLQILEDFHTLRAARAAEMRTTKLHTWSEFGWYCCNCYPRTFKLTQAAIKMEKNYCCTVCGYEDQIDMTAVTDVQIDRGCCWSRITVERFVSFYPTIVDLPQRSDARVLRLSSSPHAISYVPPSVRARSLSLTHALFICSFLSTSSVMIQRRRSFRGFKGKILLSKLCARFASRWNRTKTAWRISGAIALRQNETPAPFFYTRTGTRLKSPTKDQHPHCLSSPIARTRTRPVGFLCGRAAPCLQYEPPRHLDRGQSPVRSPAHDRSSASQISQTACSREGTSTNDMSLDDTLRRAHQASTSKLKLKRIRNEIEELRTAFKSNVRGVGGVFCATKIGVFARFKYVTSTATRDRTGAGDTLLIILFTPTRGIQ